MKRVFFALCALVLVMTACSNDDSSDSIITDKDVMYISNSGGSDTIKVQNHRHMSDSHWDRCLGMPHTPVPVTASVTASSIDDHTFYLGSHPNYVLQLVDPDEQSFSEKIVVK
jgi:hypothetical protein